MLRLTIPQYKKPTKSVKGFDDVQLVGDGQYSRTGWMAKQLTYYFMESQTKKMLHAQTVTREMGKSSRNEFNYLLVGGGIQNPQDRLTPILYFWPTFLYNCVQKFSH